MPTAKKEKLQVTRKCAADVYGSLGLPRGFRARPSASATCHGQKVDMFQSVKQEEWIWGAKKIKVYVGQGRERAHPTLGDNV